MRFQPGIPGNQYVTTQKTMPPTKKKATAKTSVKFRDLKSKKNPKGGGGADMFTKLDGVKNEAKDTKIK